MKTKDIRAMKNNEVEKQIDAKREELSKLMLTFRTKEVKNVRSIRLLKKDIARMLTLLKESKEVEAANG